MRKLIAIPFLAFGGLLVGGASAQASCLAPDALVQRYQESDTAITMVLVDRQVVGPALPGQVGPIRVYPYPPTGPLTRFSFKVARVYEGGDQDLRAGTVLTRTERTFENRPPIPVGTRQAHFLERTSNGWELQPLIQWGECAGLGSFTPEELRRAALLDRYARGRNAESFGCSREGLACWSIKRRGRDVVLRAASYRAATTDRVCVTAPDRSRSCKRLALKPDTDVLRSSRVGWSRNFPYKGHGRYLVTWDLNQVPLDRTVTGYRDLPAYLPALTFRR